jgi:hypothetical protein
MPNDYGSHQPTNSVYGGWFFYDYPYRRSVWDYRPGAGNAPGIAGADVVVTSMYFEARVYVEEFPEVEIYWGSKAKADWQKAGHEGNAIGEYRHWGSSGQTGRSVSAWLIIWHLRRKVRGRVGYAKSS